MTAKQIHLHGLLNAKRILVEQSWYYLTHDLGSNGVHTFPMVTSLKENVVARLEFELGYIGIAVRYVINYAMGTSSNNLVSWLVGFYGISTFLDYLTSNLFYVNTLFQAIKFSLSTQFNCQKHFCFKLFKQLYITIQFSVSTVSMSKTIQFQIIQFSISRQFKYKYSLIVKNISISSYSI